MDSNFELIDIKNHNFNNVLKIIKTYKELPISILSEKSNLSIPTVKKIIDYALDFKMIELSDIAPSTGGRKAHLFKINKEYAYSFYFALENKFLISKMYDFANTLVAENKREINLTDLIVEISNEIDNKSSGKNIISISIAIPAVVNNGVIVDWFYNKDFNNVDIKKIFENKFDTKVIIENDMKSTVHANYNRRKDLRDKSFACVQFGYNGIGLAQMINGEVVRGNSGFAGEIGYIDDITKNIRSIKYCSKIIKNLITFFNPYEIIFYSSERQNNIQQITQNAFKGLPQYAVAEVSTASSYIDDVFDGLNVLTQKVIYIDLSEKNCQKV